MLNASMGLIGLNMLAEKHDTPNAAVYQGIMSKAVGFLRAGFGKPLVGL